MEITIENKLLEHVKKIQSIAHAGLTYTENKFDIERYEELKKISLNLLSDLTCIEIGTIENIFINETGYQTPKVDIRGVIFKDEKLLMVKEKVDGKWSLPGGWADIGLTPKEVVTKEVLEEAGLTVKPVKLLAVFDKRNYKHPPSLFHTYKMFILCKAVEGNISPGIETTEVNYFGLDEMPELSPTRITIEQIRSLFDFLNDHDKETIFD